MLAWIVTDGLWRSLAIGASVLWLALAYLRVRGMAAYAWLGDVCAATMVSNGLAVAYSDLALGDGHFPVLKVFAVPASYEPRPTFAVVCWYHGLGLASRCWSDLEPRLLEELTSNPNAAAELRARLPQNLWDALDAGVQSVGQLTAGLYPLAGGDWPKDWVGTAVSRQTIEERFTEDQWPAA